MSESHNVSGTPARRPIVLSPNGTRDRLQIRTDRDRTRQQL
jgi:hypothetical protein